MTHHIKLTCVNRHVFSGQLGWLVATRNMVLFWGRMTENRNIYVCLVVLGRVLVGLLINVKYKEIYRWCYKT